MEPQDFLYNPQEPTGGGAAGAASAPSTSVTPAAPGQQPASTPPAASSYTQASAQPAPASAGTGGAAEGQAANQAPVSQPSWLDGFRKAGFEAKDETDAQTRLLQSHRDAERLKPLAPVLSDYQQNAAQYHAWRAEQQKISQQKQAQEDWTAKLGWAPPGGDMANLRGQVRVDESGNVVPVQGAPADVVAKFQALQSYRTEQIEKLLSNPYKYMEPAIRHIAQEIAQQHASQNVGQYREQVEAQSFITQHSNWLFEKDQQVINPQTGQYDKALSQWGKVFVNNLQQAAGAGLPPQLQQDYALKAVQNAYLSSNEYRDYLLSHNQPAQQTNTQTPRQQANAAFTQKANPAAPPSPNGSGNAVPAPQAVTKFNLDQVMLQRFRDNNVAV